MHFNTRPAGGSPAPEACDNRYCYYDVLHKDYIYTPAWVEFLIEKLADAATYAIVVGGATPVACCSGCGRVTAAVVRRASPRNGEQREGAGCGVRGLTSLLVDYRENCFDRFALPAFVRFGISLPIRGIAPTVIV